MFLSLPSFIYYKLKKLILENREKESKLLKILILIPPIILGGLNLLIIVNWLISLRYMKYWDKEV